MFLHQIYVDLGFGKTLWDNEWYAECYRNNIMYYYIKVWDYDMLVDLVTNKYPQFLPFTRCFPHKFYWVDFCRPLILHSEGGFYMDLDNMILGKFDFSKDYLLASVNHNEIANDLIYFKDKEIYIKHAIFMQNRYISCDMPLEWKARRLQHIVGQKCFNVFCKGYKYEASNVPISRDCSQTWLKIFDKKNIVPYKPT